MRTGTNRESTRHGTWVLCGLCFLLPLQVWVAAAGAPTAGTGKLHLEWDARQQKLSVDAEQVSLQTALEKLSARTHWQVYLEPGIERSITVAFRSQSPSEGLRRIVGDLNFTLAPATNGVGRLFVYQTTLRAATEVLATAKEGDSAKVAGLIKNELIVTLKPGSKETIEELAKRLGAEIVGRSDELHAYRLRFKDEESASAARTDIGTDENVASVDSNYAVSRPDRPESLAGNYAAPFTLRPTASTDASKVVVGLVDTGVQTAGTVLKDFLSKQIAVTGDGTVPSGELTHGTSMAETILYTISQLPGSEKGTPVSILSVDVYGAGETTTTFEIGKGVYAAIAGGATIINMSFGSDSPSSWVQQIIQSGHDQGVVFLGAAGNQPTGQPQYPAAYPEVIAVTAIGRDGQLASYANYGSFVDAALSGSSVVPYGDASYLVVGTSVSSARASGVAAAYASTQQKRGADIEAFLRQIAGPKTSTPTAKP